MERAEAIARLQLIDGQDLHEIAEEYEVPIAKPDGKVNKGWAGHAIERYLGLPLNSSQAPNFGSWELKVVPIKSLKNGVLTFKETMAITMIDPRYVGQTPFKESHLLAKLRKILVLTRTVGERHSDPSFVFSTTAINLEGTVYAQVEVDYELVRSCINDPQRGFNELTGKMGTLIQPRTKGAGNGSTSRAFYARKDFLRCFIDLNSPPPSVVLK